ncbi:MAG: hypothetical protein HZR80_13725 [Candidatus Heimdallarchaeota archaeon]
MINRISPEKMYILLYYFTSFLLKQFDKLILKKLNLVIFNSKYLHKYYSRYTRSSIVIYNGIELQERVNLSVNIPIKLIYIGRIEPRKSLELIIGTIALLKSKTTKFTFSIIGKTSLYPQYWAKISNMITTY